MKYLLYILAAILLFTASAYVATASSAVTRFHVIIPCNNHNYHYSPDCTPATFEQSITGWYGTLKNGEKWTQEYITRDIMLFKTESEQLKYLTYKDMVVYLD